MRVLIPATRAPSWAGGHVVPIDPDDASAYWRFWAGLWRAGESVIVVEHDITPTDEAIADLTGCDRPWCTQPYPYLGPGRMHHGLGCVKFTGEFMAATAGLWQDVALMADETHPRKHWCRLDAWSRQALQDRQQRRHEHVVRVGHAGEKPSHGCV